MTLSYELPPGVPQFNFDASAGASLGGAGLQASVGVRAPVSLDNGVALELHRSFFDVGTDLRTNAGLKMKLLLGGDRGIKFGPLADISWMSQHNASGTRIAGGGMAELPLTRHLVADFEASLGALKLGKTTSSSLSGEVGLNWLFNGI